MAKVTDSRRRSTRQASKRPTSSKTRAVRSRASSNSSKITSASNRLERALNSNNRVTSARRRSTRSTDKPVTQGRGVNKKGGEVKGTRGPARAPVQGPRTPAQQGPGRAVRGTIGERSTSRSNTAPRARGSDPTKMGRTRAAKAASTASRSAGAASGARYGNPMALAAAIIADDIMNRGVADGTLDGQPVPQQQGPQPSAPAPTIPSGSPRGAILAKKGGQTGSLIGGVFYPHPWSSAQRLRYGARGGK